jgi:hypothetical protein
MSYDVSLKNSDGGVCKVTPEEDDREEAHISVPFNYRDHFRFVQLAGVKARDAIPALENAVERLGTHRRTEDYWESTPGNAGYVCRILLAWAQQHPRATWEVTY